MTKTETSTASTALCAAGKDTPVIHLAAHQGKGGFCRFPRIKSREGSGAPKNTTIFAFED